MPEISPKAIVTNPAGLAADVRVGPFSYLGPEVTVGAGTIIANHVTILGRTRIGNACRLFPGCVVGCPPVDPCGDGSGRAPESGTCAVGDHVAIREHVSVEAGAGPAGTVLGRNNLLMVGCQVGHDACTEEFDIFANFSRLEPRCHVERFVQTSGFASIGALATVGAYSYTAGYTRVDRDAPPYSILRGIPARPRSVNVEKLRRCKIDEATIALLKKAFRALFDGEDEGPTAEKIAAVAAEFDNPHVQCLLDSLRRSAASPSGRQLEPPA